MNIDTSFGNRMKTSYKYFSGTKTKQLSLKKDEELKVNYKGTVTEGTLTIKILDSKGNIIKSLDSNTAGTETVIAKQNEKITIRVEGDKTSGSYDIMLNRK